MPSLSRRRFIQPMLAGSATTSLPVQLPFRDGRIIAQGQTVAVIGAGLAGLTAAYELVNTQIHYYLKLFGLETDGVGYDEDGIIPDEAWKSYEAFYATVAAELGPLSLAEWFDTLDLHPIARLVITQELEGEYSKHPHA